MGHHVRSRQPLNHFEPDLEEWFPMILISIPKCHSTTDPKHHCFIAPGSLAWFLPLSSYFFEYQLAFFNHIILSLFLLFDSSVLLTVFWIFRNQTQSCSSCVCPSIIVFLILVFAMCHFAYYLLANYFKLFSNIL